MDAGANNDGSIAVGNEITTVGTIIDNDVKTQTDVLLQNKSEAHLEPYNETNQNLEIESNELNDTQNNSQSEVESVLINDIETTPIENPVVTSMSEVPNPVQMTSNIELGTVLDTSINTEPTLQEKHINDVDNECVIEQQIQDSDGAVTNETTNIECNVNTSPQEVNLQETVEDNLEDMSTKELHEESCMDTEQSSNPIVEDIVNLEDASDKIIDETSENNEESVVIQNQEIPNNHEEISQDAVLERTEAVEGEHVTETELINRIETENVQESLKVEKETTVESIATDHNIDLEHVEGDNNIEHLNTSQTAENKIVKNEVITENIRDAAETIEQQMSNLVHEPEHIDTADPQSLSIVEAISRDFDETDSEDVDRPEHDQTKSLQITQDNVVGDVSISDQLQHGGTVTVTDTSGQIYYVQSVEDLIVVENDDMDETLDEPETFEVTVLTEGEESTLTTSSKTKEKSSIPSHILGRNINNPVVDTFRNGKIPPKPRLGVKIPYKNLTSQIVSKDEIAKEILERQKTRYKQSGQTTREMLFANKLTQRLAKKIAPASPTPPKTTVTVQEKATKEPLNNSDLLAILEDDTDDPESKKGHEDQEAGTSRTNTEDASDKEKNIQADTKEEIQTPTTISKREEREMALKQLQELPVTSGRRRRGGLSSIIHRSHAEAEAIAERKAAISHSVEKPSKKENDKLVQNNEQKAKDVIKEQLPQKDEAKSTPSVTSKQSTQKTEEEKEEKRKLETPNLPAENEKIPADIITNITEELNDTIKASSTNAKTAEPTQTPNSEITSKPKQEIKEEVMENVQTKSNEAKQNIAHTTSDIKKIEVTTTNKAVTSTKIANKPETNVTEVKEEFIERRVSNQPVKTYARKRKSTEDLITTSNVPDKKPAIQQKDINIPPPSYITKSSRVIKRKVIWDPDEPSTARSLPGKSPKSEPIKERMSKPPDTITKKVIPKPVQKPEIIKVQKPEIIKVQKPEIIKVQKPEIIKTPAKSPDLNKAKKRLTEVDKLLMDEGTVNMLYAFKKVDDTTTKKKKSNIISIDKAQKELMNKANELIKDLKTNSDKISPKSLRKKDSPIGTPSKKLVPATISRKRSKDSNRSSLYSPPASPSMMHMNHAEASRIIRRHSSSSFSSLDGDFDSDKKTASVLDTTPIDTEKPNKRRNTPSSAETNKVKRLRKNPEKENATAITEKAKTTDDKSKSPSKLAQIDETRKYEKYKTFSVKKIDHMVQIILLPSFNNEAYLTPEILNDLCNIMKELEQDSDCTVVVISSTASAFCHGINYKTLISDKEQSRKTFAKKLAVCVTNLLRSLATFPKILVAGVHGDTVGLGVTILPLFDMVIASDTATFSIPNARLGCAVEGGSLLSLPHLMHNVLVSELLYASRKLIAAEALRLGMVTRVLWPDKFQQELVAIVKNISNYSPQFMELTKKQLRQHMSKGIEEALGKEIDTLIQHWTSSECQKNFGVYG